MTEIRVCVVGLRGIPGVMGGVESHCEEIFPRLKAISNEFQVTVIGRRPYVSAPPYDCHGIRVVPLPASRNKYLEAISNTILGVLYARFVVKADILHIHGIGPALLGPMARLLGLRVVVTHHGQDFAREKWNVFAKRVLRLGERWAVFSAHRLIVVSKSVTEELRQRYPRYQSRIRHIPNGAAAFPEIGREDEESILRELGLASKSYILGVGRLVPEKGFHDLIAAYKRADPGLSLAIAGKADHEDEYSRSLLEQASERVRFCGFQSREVLQVLYRHAALFVLPSSHEGLPIAALEAAGLGAPILLSDIRPNVDIGLPAANYFPVGDIEALGQKLLQAAENYRVDRNVIAQRFNWDLITEETRKVYAAVSWSRRHKHVTKPGDYLMPDTEL